VNALWPVLACLAFGAASPESGADVPRKYLEGLPFPMGDIREPAFPRRTVSITSYGAAGDGVTMNTDAIQRAIRDCAGAGGGTVDVPPGIWLTGPIRLMSNIRLHVGKGAVVLFSRRFEDYPLIAGPDGTARSFRCIACIYGYRLENVAITGGGMFDGQGESWRPVKKEKMTRSQWQRLLTSGGAVSADGGTWFPSRGAMEGEEYVKSLSRKEGVTADDYLRAREFLRPVMVQLVDCRNVLIDGGTYTNSPSFHIQPVQCEDVVIRNISVTAEWFAQNGDGIDISSCRRVVVYDCLVNAGDDAICLKPGKLSPRQGAGAACENIVIADCVVYHGHGGFVIGSQTYGGARNIAVRNCSFHGTDVGLRFKSAKGKGGRIENVYIDGITMTSIGAEAILFDLLYSSSPGTASAGDPPGNDGGEHLPEFRNVLIKNIVCAGAETAVRILGLVSMPVQGITLDSVVITSATGLICTDADGTALRHVSIRPAHGPVMSFTRSHGVTISGAPLPVGAQPFLRVEESGPGAITLEGSVPGNIELGAGVSADAVVRR
jgi:polygalacturonase